MGSTAITAVANEKPVTTAELEALAIDEPPVFDISDSPVEQSAPTETTMTDKPVPRSWYKRPWVMAGFASIVIVGSLGAIITLLIAGRGTLADYSLRGVRITAHSTPAEYKQPLTDLLKNYRFSIKDANTPAATFTAADAGLSVNVAATVQSVQDSQHHATWTDKLAFWRTITYPLHLSVDETKLANFVKDHMVKTTVEPMNATLATETGQIVITPETSGRGITVANPRASVISAVSYLKPTHVITLSTQAIPAAVSTKDLAPLQASIEAVAQTPVEIVVNGTVYHADEATITRWVDPVDAGATEARFEINSGKVAAWITGIAADYTSPTVNEVRISDPAGNPRVLAAGKSGSSIAGMSAVASEIVDSLNNKQPVTKQLAVVMKSFKVVNVTAYDKWLLADLSNHMLYAYEREQLVRSFPMSAGAPETPTVVGEYKIYSKVRSQTMRGPNADGTSYNVPNVEWVSYFHADYAIHGNYWRPLSVFGTTNTSHGCIGMINDNSRWVYDWAPIGTPVITYN